MTIDTVTGARRDLGLLLARLRDAAGETQISLSRQIGYSRSTVANAEAGQGAARLFWEKCDQVLGSGNQLVAAYEGAEDLRRRREEDALAAEQSRRDSAVRRWREDHPVAAVPVTDADRRGRAAHTVAAALHSTLAVHEDAAAKLMDPSDLEHRALGTYQEHSQSPGPLSMTLVGGFAGSGKSEFARFLSAVTGWTILDKDILTRALVEQLLISLDGDPNDRQTELYQTRVRPHEYRCLLDQALENLACGISVILTAPFLREYTDGAWLRRVQNRCAAHGASLTVVWVKCDVESMSDYLHFRGASRDAWKLANWDEYLAMIDPDFEPTFPHCVVDNGLNAAVALAEQAREIAMRVTRDL